MNRYCRRSEMMPSIMAAMLLLAVIPASSPATDPCPCPQGTSCGYLPISEPIWCDVSRFCWCMSIELCSPTVAYVVEFTPFLPDEPAYPINCITEGCAGVCFIEDTEDCAYYYHCESTFSSPMKCEDPGDCNAIYSHFARRQGWWATSVECCNIAQ